VGRRVLGVIRVGGMPTSCQVLLPSPSTECGLLVKENTEPSSSSTNRGSIPLASRAANTLRLLESKMTKENWPCKLFQGACKRTAKKITCACGVPWDSPGPTFLLRCNLGRRQDFSAR